MPTSLARLAAASSGTLLALGLMLLHPGWLESLNLALFDRLAAASRPASSPVAVVEIDDRSLTQFGRWPWPRSRTAALADAIAAGKPAALALVMLFPEPDSGDVLLGRALSRCPSATGFYFDAAPGSPFSQHCPLHPLPHILNLQPSPFPAASGAVCNSAPIRNDGFLNAQADSDGILRSVPLIVTHRHAAFPSLPLAAVLAAQPSATSGLRPRPLAFRLGDVILPLDARGAFAPTFLPPQSFQRISAADLLSGKVPATTLLGRFVFAGITAKGFGDAWRVYGHPEYPGVYVHASVAQHLLLGGALAPVGTSTPAELLLLLFFGAATGIIFSRGGLKTATWVCALAILGAASATLAFAQARDFVSPIPAFLAVGINGIAAAASRGRREESSSAKREMKAAHDFMLAALASLTALRDVETGGHLDRIQISLRLLCSSLQHLPRFRSFLTPENIDLLVTVAPIHDIGKIGIPDEILLKSGRLTADEMSRVRLHVHYGREVLERAKDKSGLDHPVLFEMCNALVFSHHERWDGSGYPCGLKGDEIPIPARLLAVVDVYDALVSRRVYKPEFSHQDAIALIAAGRATLFDPDIVDAFLAQHERFDALKQPLSGNGRAKSTWS